LRALWKYDFIVKYARSVKIVNTKIWNFDLRESKSYGKGAVFFGGHILLYNSFW